MLKNELNIGGTLVGGAAAPYVIAEVGSNFDKNLDKARKLIDVAKEVGADAVKFQLFRADTLYPNRDGLYDIFKSIELDAEWVPLLDKHAREQGLHFMASAFDMASVDVLEAVDTPAHKVASSETTNLGFLHKLASTGKPIIISTGMCDMVDVEEAVNACLGAGNNQVVLLQCGAMYPLPNEQVNLRVIQSLARRFNCPVGFSDHTLGQVAATTAVGLGATVFEKHYTLDKKGAGPDHFYALEPDELKSYIAAIREAHEALGSGEKQMLPKERELGRREGLYLARNMAKGETITPADIVVKRPAVGLRARYASAVVGATLTQAVEKDQPLNWDALSFGGAK
ncbi:N-acetylneuraminate synthase family protein [Pusillimonas minor]|uniref:N-acetylneuraminate synthase family protein n=1 Tax=Pusillimonas minor TaxID=2697024 RepID=A0A842HQU3_9BURK|nr:N-acetylneuraminate synthase family protein [Pusillimonas minor]MBC2770576.1 N-acetylneuraminate synthase family protein [Pusillimonas minor]